MTVAGASQRVILHLGMQKTGSTSIQEAFADYADERMVYLQLGNSNHSWVLGMAFDQGSPLKLEGEAERNALRAEAQAQIATALDTARPRSVLLSAEGLSNFTDVRGYENCVAFLENHGAEVSALVYVRDPASYTASLFNQRARRSNVPVDPLAFFPLYRDHLAVWEKALKGRIEYVLFDRATLKGGDVLKDFAMRVGLDETRLRRPDQWSNMSFSAEALAVLFLLRARAKEAMARLGGQGRRELLLRLRQFGLSRFAFARPQVEAALAQHADQVAWIEQRLGRPMPRGSQEGALEFANREELLAWGGSLGPRLGEWLAGQDWPPSDPVMRLLREVAERLTRQPV